MTNSDDQFDDDLEAASDDYERLDQALLAHLEEFMDEEGVDEEVLAGLLADAALRMRMAAYAGYAESPSVTGFKLDLDRFARLVEDSIREAKKVAAEFIDAAKTARAQAENEPEDEPGAG
jgi:hypothetical protein